MGTITVDGGAYDVYQHTQVNQPSIQGTTTFVQYFSIRQSPRSCGHISVAEHFSQWATLGLQPGAINSARLLVEAGGGPGSATFSTATMTAN